MSGGTITLEPAALRREAAESERIAAVCRRQAAAVRAHPVGDGDLGVLGTAVVQSMNRILGGIAGAVSDTGELWDRIADALVVTAEDHERVDAVVGQRCATVARGIGNVDVPQMGD